MTTLAQASAAIRAGSVSPNGLVAECLERIDRTDGELHAWVHVDHDGARRAAELAEEELRCGTYRGPMHGIPVGVKDIIDVAGMPTRAGSPLTESRCVEVDAPVVAALRAAGAIVLGKTVTTQFACFDPAETVNPWDATRTPGGSSSGSAVAVATGSCYAALGTQTGGSIVRPASYCGVVGLKPTLGRWSMRGIVPVSFHLDHVGPMVRSVADAALVCAAVEGCAPTGSLTASSAAVPPTLGLPAGFFRDRAEPQVLSGVNSAVAALAAAGARVEHVELPRRFDEVLARHRCIMAVEVAQYHRTLYGRQSDAYAPGIRRLIDEGLRTSVLDYADALRHRIELLEDLGRAFRRGPSFWVTPATTSPAPPRETTGDPSFNSAWSYCGFPAITIRCGTSDAGLPIGLQLIARTGQDDELLQAARWCEQVLCLPT